MTNIFETKEDYLKLRVFWKTFHAEGGYKPKKISYTAILGYNISTKEFITQEGYDMVSDLTVYHHAIYLAATGKSLEKAFLNISWETASIIKHKISWTLARFDKQLPDYDYYYFKLFGDAIDQKYYTAIQQIIIEFITTKEKSLLSNLGKHHE